MNINKILVVMDMENGDCTSAMDSVLYFIDTFKANIDVLVVLESVKKAEDVALSFGMPFDPHMKEDSIKRAMDKLKHMFPKDVKATFHVKVGYFDKEMEDMYEKVKPDLFLVACNNFSKDLSKFAKSIGKPILLIN